MSPADDFTDEMDTFPFDGNDADAVFGASPESDCVPEELRDVADLVLAARQVGSPEELAGEDVIVAQIAAAIGEHVSSPAGDAHERTSVLSKFRTAKVAAAATAVLVIGATAAAAATGSLPAPVQSSVASGLSGVGINVPAHHHIALASKHVATPAHAPGHHRRKPVPGAAGIVASVNGVSVAGTCGVADSAGPFTLTGRKGATFTVNVATTTTFLDQGVTGPSFVNVCVGDGVFAKGAVTGMTVTAASVLIAPMKHEHAHHHGVLGTVVSVNGVTTAGTCGAAMTSGSFVVTGHKGAMVTVDVDGSTKFFTPGVMDGSFANVCVGAKVGASGDTSGTTLAATNVFVLPAHMGEHHDGVHQKKVAGHFPMGFGFPKGFGHEGLEPAGSGHKDADPHGKGTPGAKHGR